MNRSAHGVARPVIALAIALSLLGGVAEAQTKVNPGWNMFSAQQDVEIGAQSAAEAERQLPILRDAEVESYVNRIGQKLAVNAGGPQFQYRFRVINASDINAFALPGGFIYLNRGIIENARNEGEVAGVLAHEIAHSALRHGTHQASKAYAAQAGLQILGGLLGGKVGNNTAQILNTVGGIGLNALFLKFSRELETQADVRGAQILAASGYTPADMVSFFDQLAKVDKSKKTTWLSHHPAPPDRQARIEKERQLLREPATPTQNVAQLNRIKSELRTHGSARSSSQIAQGTSSSRGNPPMTSSGTSIGNVPAPSTSLRKFTNRSGAYAIGYPSNWRVYDSGGFGVTIAPEGGIGDAGGRTEIVYGLMVNHYDPFGNSPRSYLREGGASTSVTLQDAANDLIAQIRQSSPHLRVISGSGQQLRLDGKTAVAASLRGTNPNTRINERVTVVTRALPDGHLIYVVFVTPEQDASQYSKVLSSVVASLDVSEGHRH
ncbi:MAG TPA: M48 family metallopeptidase [Thermoanaerobaculia bacterium]|nr:M48 family metallopeptidase [Candidatus Binatia bacterium]HYC61890.1 M48 family metallopeptidase [Thermoanaerobaculia bacterium]